MMPLSQLAQALPVDIKDWETLGVATIANLIAMYFGDDLFKLLVGIGTLCLFALSGARKYFAVRKEYEESRAVALENERKELENRRLKHEVEKEEAA